MIPRGFDGLHGPPGEVTARGAGHGYRGRGDGIKRELQRHPHAGHALRGWGRGGAAECLQRAGAGAAAVRREGVRVRWSFPIIKCPRLLPASRAIGVPES